MLRSRKSAQSPAVMLEQLRTAQEDHRIAVKEANDQLLNTHNAIFELAADRQQTINEQISLLRAEADGLEKVKTESTLPAF